MLTENKFSRYLLYAFGEIILVVIGILIALQINNWNEDHSVELEVGEQMNSMVKELKEDITFFNDIIESDSRRIQFLRSLSTQSYDTLELAHAPSRISFNYDTRIFGIAYQSLKENGRLNLIRDIGLKESMTVYFEQITVGYNNQSDWQKEFVTTNIEPFIIQELPLDSNALTRPEVVMDQLTKTEFQNIVHIQLWNHKRISKHAAGAIESADKLIQSIEEYLSIQ